jgi:hypothetical protein
MWPFTKLEPHQINYFETKERLDKKEQLKNMEDALI